MARYRLIENTTVEGSYKNTNKTHFYKNCTIIDFPIHQSATVKEYIFLNCRVESMKIRNVQKNICLVFIGCKIKGLKIEKKTIIPNIKFFGCELADSEFSDSKLPGITFSYSFKEYYTIEKERITLKKKEPLFESKISNVNFLFCDLNDLRLKDTNCYNSSFKHCLLGDLDLSGKVIMRTIKLQGTTILKGELKKCVFSNIIFHEGNSFSEFIGFLRGLPTRISLYYSFIKAQRHERRFRRPQEEKEQIELNVRRKVFDFKRHLKKFLYKIPLIPRLVDFLSTTELYKVGFQQADYSKAHDFYRHVQNQEYIDDLKFRNPLAAFLYSFLASYMRSFPAVLLRMVLVVVIFAFFYSGSHFSVDQPEHRKDVYEQYIDKEGHPLDPCTLSFKIFFGSSIYPMEEADESTNRLIIIQTIIGYFALALIAGVFVNHVHHRISIPRNRGDTDNDKP